MAKARAIVKRRKAVRNIRKITRTMQLIATARFNQALKRAMATKPYTEKITEMVGELSRAIQGRVDHPLLRVNEGTGRTALLVITSNRGLCGGYNAHVLRTAIAHRERSAEGDAAVDVSMVGKKGISYFRFLRREMAEQITGLISNLKVELLAPVIAKGHPTGDDFAALDRLADEILDNTMHYHGQIHDYLGNF